MTKTTDDDFKDFQNAFMQYVELLNLRDWRITFTRKPLNDCFAELLSDPEGCCATASLSTEIDDGAKRHFNAAASGKHEAIHLLLVKLQHLAQSRFVSESQISTETERLVRILEKALP